MENFEEKDMKILTQEEFNENFVGDISSSVTFENYIVGGVFYINDIRYKMSLIFKNCIFQGITSFNVVGDEIPWHEYGYTYFYNCKIVDYENILNIEKYIFENCTFLKPVPLACPESGEFVGYKQCKNLDNYYIIKLLIPFDAKRSSAFSNKCRCSKAKVLGIFDLDGNELKDVVVYSGYDIDFKYKVGEYVYPDSFDEDRYHECSNGIHFFMSFDEARDY